MKQRRTIAMVTQIKPETRSVYDQDLYVWTEVQAELLRARRFEALDLDHLIEELAGLGDTKTGLGDTRKSAVLSGASVIIEHLLELQHSPAQAPRRGWAGSVLEDRARLELERTPRLRQILEDELPPVYAIVRHTSARKLRLYGEDAAAAALPAACSCGGGQIAGDGWP